MQKAMIISVGGTPQPILKSIEEHSPEFISFFASQDTSDTVAQIKAEISGKGSRVTSELTLIDDVNDLLHCHDKAEEAVQRVLSRKLTKEHVIVDYTGGTKNMSVALALAAITHGFSFSYIGGKERTKDGVGIVVNGKEQVYHSVNPWDFLAIDERRKIALLYNQHQFNAARELADSLQEKTTKYKTIYKKVSFLLDGYYKWDSFRYEEADAAFKRAKIDELLEADDKAINAFASATRKLLPRLGQIIAGGKKPNVELINDLMLNAERRREEGKNDDAVLRLYRIVEMAAQERLLAKYGIDASAVREDQIPNELKPELLKCKSPRDGKIKIPQTAAFKLLQAHGDELGRLFSDHERRFLDIQSTRNYSYLAHGFECSREKTYDALRLFVLDLGIVSIDDAARYPKMVV